MLKVTYYLVGGRPDFAFSMRLDPLFPGLPAVVVGAVAGVDYNLFRGPEH